MLKKINIAMLGYGFMGKAHSRAFRDVGRFFDIPFDVNLKTICGRNKDEVQSAAKKYGWEKSETDWNKIVTDPEIDIVDVATPNNVHKEQVIKAAENKKHIICEKPLANNLADAVEMAKAADKAGVKSFVLFNYRRVPAIALAREIILSGDLGDIYHFRAFYLQDWLVNPQVPRLWRMEKSKAGSGALGDIGAHIIDLAYFLIGEIDEVCAVSKTFIDKRPLPENPKEFGVVDVDDAVAFMANFKRGIYGTFEATRFATGRKNFNGFEIYGSKGSLFFNFEDMNELHYFSNTEKNTHRGFKRILVTESDHPYIKSWWPPGHIIGYEHTFVNAVYDFITGIHEDKKISPDFSEGAKNLAVLEAVQNSAKEKAWKKVAEVVL